MITKGSIDVAGLPRLHHLYAVFHDGDACRQAADALKSMGIESEQLQGNDAALLEHPAAGVHLLARLERLIKDVGGESHMATIYAQHLRMGRVVLAAPVPDKAMASGVAQAITRHGGYEVTYLRDWSIAYMSPEENAAHGLPAHCGTNTDE